MGGNNKLRTRTCLYCKEAKTLPWKTKQRFCSPECFQKWQVGSNNAYYKGMKEYTCANCNLKFSDYPYRQRSARQFCSQKCAKQLMWAEYHLTHHPNWKGGRMKIPRGYIKIKEDSHPFADRFGYVLEHRVVMEAKIGRLLTKYEVVHHVNGIKDDNRIENLRLFKDNNEHIQFHIKENPDFGYLKGNRKK